MSLYEDELRAENVLLQARIDDLIDRASKATARSIERNGEYEQQIQQVKEDATGLVEALCDRLDVVDSQRSFLAQIIVAVLHHEGDPKVIKDILTVAIQEWLPKR